jgi:hypothetical protein
MLIVEGSEQVISRVERLVALLNTCGDDHKAISAIDANMALWEELAGAKGRRRS